MEELADTQVSLVGGSLGVDSGKVGSLSPVVGCNLEDSGTEVAQVVGSYYFGSYPVYNFVADSQPVPADNHLAGSYHLDNLAAESSNFRSSCHLIPCSTDEYLNTSETENTHQLAIVSL